MVNNCLIAERISGSNLNLVTPCGYEIVQECLLPALTDCHAVFIAQCPVVAADPACLNRSFKVNGSVEGATAAATERQARYLTVDINRRACGHHAHIIVHGYLYVANAFAVECMPQL